MSRDVLLYGATVSDEYQRLMEWARSAEVHDFVADFHRLQLEQWVWLHRGQLCGKVLDVGVLTRRSWVGPGYTTFGEYGCDVTGSLLDMPFHTGEWDAVLLTEVLEHCTDPMQACREVHRVMKPGGLLLVTSPFLWPWHGTKDYKDYWRFTADAWTLLLRDFTDVRIHPALLTPEGAQAYDLLRRFECLGFANQTEITTGYMCEATK